MDKIKKTWEKDGYVLRPAKKEDAWSYYRHNFNPLDSEVARLTGSKTFLPVTRLYNFSIRR